MYIMYTYNAEAGQERVTWRFMSERWGIVLSLPFHSLSRHVLMIFEGSIILPVPITIALSNNSYSLLRT